MCKLDPADIDVAVMEVPPIVIPRLGIGGFVTCVHQITVTVDVEHTHQKANFAQVIWSMLARELHHCARAVACGFNNSNISGSSLVAEGLACCFEEKWDSRRHFKRPNVGIANGERRVRLGWRSCGNGAQDTVTGLPPDTSLAFCGGAPRISEASGPTP
ncbi:DUF2268 domain-containing putative Zn-dependent protease [Falsiruegeria mediterranea]